jgi:tetratricopeptide (TPR) repeat protein
VLRLGLLERQIAQEGDLYRVTHVLGPLLLPVLSEAEWEEALRLAAQKLYEVWWQLPKRFVDLRVLESIQLAMDAGEQELAVVPAQWLATGWINSSRYLEAAALCNSILKVFEDYRILGAVARAEQVLGETDAAHEHYTRALELCPPLDEREKALSAHNLATLEARCGNVARALELWQQARAIQDRIGNERGKAGTLSAMAAVISRQGDGPRALELWQQALEIQERIGHKRGHAATLDAMALAIAGRGDIPRAFELWQQSLELRQEIGDVLGEASILRNMAGIIAEQGDIPRAFDLWEQSLELERGIGNVNGEADVLYEMGLVIGQQGDFRRALELWRQSLDIYQRIGDLRSIGQTLSSMAWAAHECGLPERSDELNVWAAQALGCVRDYVRLVRVLGNLGISALQGRTVFAAQSAWLVLRMQASADTSVRGLRPLFSALSQGDPLVVLLAAAAKILIEPCSEREPQLDKLRELAAEMGAAAGQNGGSALDPQLSDPNSVFPELSRQLEELIGDRWTFDRTPLLDVTPGPRPS